MRRGPHPQEAQAAWVSGPRSHPAPFMSQESQETGSKIPGPLEEMGPESAFPGGGRSKQGPGNCSWGGVFHLRSWWGFFKLKKELEVFLKMVLLLGARKMKCYFPVLSVAPRLSELEAAPPLRCRLFPCLCSSLLPTPM